MITKKLVPASLASQKHEAPEDAAREEPEFYINKRTADLVSDLLGILGTSTWRIRQGLCPLNPGLGINGCSGCQEGKKPLSVNLRIPPHRHQFQSWVHRAFRTMEEALFGQEKVLLASSR